MPRSDLRHRRHPRDHARAARAAPDNAMPFRPNNAV
jgi:hypothetical protein